MTKLILWLLYYNMRNSEVKDGVRPSFRSYDYDRIMEKNNKWS